MPFKEVSGEKHEYTCTTMSICKRAMCSFWLMLSDFLYFTHLNLSFYAVTRNNRKVLLQHINI